MIGNVPMNAAFAVSAPLNFTIRNRKERLAARDAARRAIKDAGFTDAHRKRFPFVAGDAESKAAARNRAEALRDEIKAATGIDCEVGEASLL